MQEINIQELYELYLDTLKNFGSHLLTAADDLIEYYAFEEFNVGAHTFLHEVNLAHLHEAGLINDAIMEQSGRLRTGYFVLECSADWNVDAFKTSTSWYQLLKMADQLNHLVQP